MNRFLAAIAVLAALPLVAPAHAQHSPQPTSPLLAQAAAAPDAILLAKAFANWWQTDRYQTDSQIQVSRTVGEKISVSTARTRTIVQSPRKFRAEITYEPASPSTPTITVISNGELVWIYRPDLQQYMVKTYAEFDQLEDSYYVGLGCLFFLQFTPEDQALIAQGALSNLITKSLQSGTDIAMSSRQLADRRMMAYEYTDRQTNQQLTALIDPTTADLRQLQVMKPSATGEAIDIAETILSRDANPTITDATFRFTPPAGVERVEALAIAP